MTQMLSAKEQPLAKIFSDDYVFTIPGYQRPYSWTSEQARELFDDLLAYMRGGGPKLDEIPPYFLGSIVLIKRDAIAEATVVDGQQRLTTLTLLLSAIRSSIQDPIVRASIAKRIYEQGDVVTATENHYRLSLRERDRQFFRDHVQHEGGIEKLAGLNDKLPDSQSRLRDNARLFLDELLKLEQHEQVRLVQFIATRCYLVAVSTQDIDSAYRIFGVLNSRGLDLSATDILKADIIGKIEASSRDEYTERWEGLEENLGRDAFGELFSHIRMVYRKAKPQSTLLKEFRDHVGPSDSRGFIDNVLRPMAQAFREIIDADYSSQKLAERINDSLSWLNRIEFKDWVPAALAFFSRHRNDPVAMLRFVSDLERLAYSMLVRKAGVNERIDRFAKLTSAVEASLDLQVEESPLQLSASEQFQTYTALSGPIYETHSARSRSVILLRLDGLLSGGGATYDHEIVTVEHVLPQTPKSGSGWLYWIPNPQDRLQWVHRLGNLALLTRKKNSSASNYEFEQKKNAYFVKGGISPFALTTQVLQHSEWKLAAMQERQNHLLQTFEQHWKLQGRKSPEVLATELLAELTNTEDWPIFELQAVKAPRIYASAREAGETFVVLAGSKARPWIGQYHSYQNLQRALISDGMLIPGSGDLYEFIKDVAFKSPSAASAIVLGRADNGRTSWLVKGLEQTYADWQKSLPPGRHVTGEQEQSSST